MDQFHRDYLQGVLNKVLAAPETLFDWEFIFETDDDDDDGYRKIRAPTKEAAIEELKKQTKGQKIRVSAIQSKKVQAAVVEAMGKRADGLVTKKINQSIYNVEYKGRKFEIELSEPYGNTKSRQWQLVEDEGGYEKTYVNHYDRKDDALYAIKTIVDRDTQTTAAPHRNDDIEHTIRQLFKASSMGLGPKATIEIKPSKVSGKLVSIFSDHTALSFKDIMSLRARLNAKFHGKGVRIGSYTRHGRAYMKYSFLMREVKKDQNGKAKLDKKPGPKPQRKVGNKVKASSIADAAFARLQVAAKLKF